VLRSTRSSGKKRRAAHSDEKRQYREFIEMIRLTVGDAFSNQDVLEF
jgi:hypothetical protein